MSVLVPVFMLAALVCAYIAGYTHHQVVNSRRRLKALDRAGNTTDFNNVEWWDGFLDCLAWTDNKERTP